MAAADPPPAGIHTVTRLLARQAAPEKILQQAARTLHEILPAELVAIIDLEAGPDDAALVRLVEGDAPDADEPAGEVLPLKHAEILNHLAETCRTRVLDGSLQLDHELAPLIDQLSADQIRSALLVPISHSDRCIGFLAALSGRPDRFDAAHRRLGRIYGDLLGAALHASDSHAAAKADADRYRRRNQALARELNSRPQPARAAGPAPGASGPMAAIHELAAQVAGTDAPVLIGGETGTGKEVMARWLHAHSPRRDEAFVAVNCAALPRELIESELFGHVKGAFSGAISDRAGRFEAADGGTLLLDEIGEMPVDLQPKLLRVLQEGVVTRVGGDRPVPVDVRVLAATNVDLAEAIRNGEFREDLYFRLNVFPLALPPLRERFDDLPRLCRDILAEISARVGRGPWEVSDEALAALRAYDWPGNIRELVNTLERSVILSKPPRLKVHLIDAGLEVDDAPDDGWPTLEQLTRRYIEKVLKKTGGQVYGEGGAAEVLDLKPTTLQSRLKRMGIDRADFSAG